MFSFFDFEWLENCLCNPAQAYVEEPFVFDAEREKTFIRLISVKRSLICLNILFRNGSLATQDVLRICDWRSSIFDSFRSEFLVCLRTANEFLPSSANLFVFLSFSLFAQASANGEIMKRINADRIRVGGGLRLSLFGLIRDLLGWSDCRKIELKSQPANFSHFKQRIKSISLRLKEKLVRFKFNFRWHHHKMTKIIYHNIVYQYLHTRTQHKSYLALEEIQFSNRTMEIMFDFLMGKLYYLLILFRKSLKVC